MKTRIYVTLIALSAFLAVSCSTSVHDRIDAYPEVFNALPDWEKQEVSKGGISVGMSPEAVKLAWGNPQHIEAGQIGNKYTQRWIYSIRYAVNSPHYGWGGFYGPYRGYYAPVYYPVDYIPVEVGHVVFQNNKVVSWGRTRN